MKLWIRDDESVVAGYSDEPAPEPDEPADWLLVRAWAQRISDGAMRLLGQEPVSIPWIRR